MARVCSLLPGPLRLIGGSFQKAILGFEILDPAAVT
jgi:hypothetical protein